MSRVVPRCWRSGSLLALLCSGATGAAAADVPQFVFEAYPSDVLASKQLYHQNLAAAGSAVQNVPFYLLVPQLQRWVPGQVVRVAFNGGSKDLHQRIAGVANRWITETGINLRFSFTDNAGNFRTWTTDDAVYAAEVRIAFYTDARGGNWSHVGTDSTNVNLVGGLAGQASMNLGGFDRQLPIGWEGTVLHEFGHALGFEHEHQSPAGGCDFRFEDDPGYVATTDAAGLYTVDAQGRRPGLYTYLGGYSNRWPREKVDSNLKVLPVSSAFLVGAFDKNSIMKYQFPAFFFKAEGQSPCFTPNDNRKLSAEDIAGVRKTYPPDANIAATQITERRATLTQLLNAPKASAGVRIQTEAQLKAIAAQ